MNALATLLNHPYCQAFRAAMPEEWHTGAYFVGGVVRDALHKGTVSKDIDLVTTEGPALQLAQRVETALHGRLVPLHEDFGIYRVVTWPDGPDTEPVYWDIADAVGGHLTTDLTRRDLTVNAMAFSLAGGDLIDPYNGQTDLAQGIIRAVSRQNLVDDPLRLLRVFRCGAQLTAATLDVETNVWVAELKDSLTQAAPERLQMELLKLLRTPHSFAWLQHMEASGLLEVLLPEMTAMRAIPPNSHHHLPLLEHTLELVNQLETVVIPELPEEWRTYLATAAHGNTSHKALVTLACLLHDIGKPDTHEVLDTGRHTFYAHERVGEDMTLALCKRLKLGNTLTQQVGALVRWHLYPWAFNQTSAKKSLLRFYRRMGALTPDLLCLAMADRLSTRGPDVTDEQVASDLADMRFLLAGYTEAAEANTVPPLLSGKEVMTLLNLPPGPIIGQWLSKIREAQLLGELTSPEEAQTWLQQQAVTIA